MAKKYDGGTGERPGRSRSKGDGSNPPSSTGRRGLGAGGGTPEPDLLDQTAAEIAEIAPDLPDESEIPANRGNIVQVFGADPTNRYSLRYEIRELGDLITSNTDTGTINPDYPKELQPRDRTRAASRRQIENMAANLQPDALTAEFMALDRGAPIIGDDNVVESGNGRTMALRRANQLHPDKYTSYTENIRKMAAERGIDPAAVDQFENPVLVRVRVDDVDRAAFAQEANTAAILGMSATERAATDSSRISTAALINFETGSSRTIDEAITRRNNREFVTDFIGKIPESERADLMDRSGQLTQAGINRIKGAMFTRVYNDTQLADTIFESPDSDIKNITNAMMNSLGPLAGAEEMVKSGQRSSELSIAGDITTAVKKYQSLKEIDMPVEMYLRQTSMFGDTDITPTQKAILTKLHENRRSAKALTQLLTGWADVVERQPHPDQGSMFGPVTVDRDQLISDWLESDGSKQQSLF